MISTQLPNLYAIRIFLAIVVIIGHVPLLSRGLGLPFFDDSPFFFKGKLAVYYFFTLSGYLIIRQLYLEYEATRAIDIYGFYLRRVRRIYPVYILVIIVGLVAYQVLLPLISPASPSNYSVGELLLYYVFLIPNIFNIQNPDVELGLYVLWSIGVEEQFYLVMPLIAFLVKGRFISSLLVILIVLISLLFWSEFYAYGNYYFYFVIGGIFSILGGKYRMIFFNWRFVKYAVMFCFFVSFFTNYFEFEDANYFHLFHSVMAGSMIYVISICPPAIISNTIITYFGKISYGMYMYHALVLSSILLISKMAGFDNFMPPFIFIFVVTVLTIVGTLIVASCSYEFFEKRFYGG